jgi:hypothetical protein
MPGGFCHISFGRVHWLNVQNTAYKPTMRLDAELSQSQRLLSIDELSNLSDTREADTFPLSHTFLCFILIP